jgi:alpha-ketoglutarate-dependent taurine dioxygenase
MVALTKQSFFTEGQVPEQRVVEGGVPFPQVLQPQSPVSDISSLVAAIAKEKAWLEKELERSGAILFRGFDVATAADFDAVVKAFDYLELPYVGGAAPRSSVVGRVFTSNESPPDQKIPFHHEMAQVPEYPGKVFFYCEIEPAEGGETPILLSHLVYQRMEKEWPEFVQKLHQHGLLYTRILGAGDDPSSPIGRGWQSTFLTKDREEAEKRASKLGMQLEWLEDGVKTVSGPIPAVKIDELRKRPVWFNSMVAAYTGWEDARNDPVKAVTFGDGTPLPKEAVLACLQVLTEESVSIPWRHGDVLLLDNIAVQHARKAFVPPRRVLASLAK